MKKWIFTLITCTSVLVLPSFGGKLDRTKAPSPGPAPEIKIGAYQFFELENGLKVYVVENHKLPTLNISLRLNIDPLLEKEKVGFVEATGGLLMRGTTTRTKLQLDEEIDFLGARLRTSSKGLYAGSLSKHADKLFELIGDIILQPAFPKDELAKIKKQMEAGLQSLKTDPQQILSRVRARVLFGASHPYGEILTEDSLAAFKLEDCQKYYETYFRPNVGYLSIVGDITLEEAKKLVTTYLGSWERRDVPKHTYTTPAQPEKTQVIIVNKDAAVQTVLALGAPVEYSVNSPNYLSGKIMTNILGGGAGRRLYNNLREEKGLTYGAYSRLEADKLVGTFSASAQVRNEVTADAVSAFKFEFEKIRKDAVPIEELSHVKATMTGAFARSLEKPQTVAGFAINTAIYNLPQDFYQNYLKNLEAVSVEEIQKCARTFVPGDNGYIFAIGNADELKDSLKDFGELRVLDINGEAIAETIAIPDGMTATLILDQYFGAIGGRSKLQEVHSLSSVGTFSTMGMELQYSEFKSEPGKFAMEIQMNGQIMVKQVLNVDKGYSMQMGQKKEFTPEEVSEMTSNAFIFPELHWTEQGITVELTGTEVINGKNAYKLTLTKKDGDQRNVYYDMDSHLKLKAISTKETPQGNMTITIDIQDYMDVEGIKFPKKVDIQNGPQTMKMDLTEILVNPKIEGTPFSLD